MPTELKENCIEWYTGENIATVSLSQKRYITRLRRIAEKCPQCVEIIAENADGSITARISLACVHLTKFGSKNGPFDEAGSRDDDEEDGDG